MQSHEHFPQASHEKPPASRALESKPGQEETPEERAKLQLKSASPEEWEDLFSQVERTGESAEQRKAREQHEAEQRTSEEERSRIRQEEYEDLFLKTMHASEQDAQFAALPDAERLSKTAETVYPQAYEMFRRDFPNENPDMVGGRAIAAYGNFVANNIQLDPFKRVEALKAGDLLAKKMIERRKEMGLQEAEEIHERASKEGFTEVRLGRATKELQGMEAASKTEGEERAESFSTGMTMEQMKRQDALRRLKKLHEEAEQLRAAHAGLEAMSDEDVEAAFGRISKPPEEKGN